MTSEGPHGIAVVDKPSGPSSHAIVARARKAWGTRRVGHAGTLDPLATGVLILGVGSATRLLGHLSAQGKGYLSTIALGLATTTDDAQGEVTLAPGALLTRDEVEAAMRPWRGTVRQRPSAVSAVHIGGQRAHELVRAGKDVQIPDREVHIEEFDLLDVRSGQSRGIPVTLIDVRVSCSAGTYVRALARDIGESLGVGGHVTSLRRTRSGALTLDDACHVDDIGAHPVLASGVVARRSMPWVEVEASDVPLIRHGVQIPWPEAAPSGGAVAFLHGDDLVALAEYRDGRAAYAAVFPHAIPA